MRLKNLLGIVNDKKRDIQERLLLLTALIALIALFAVFVGGFFVGENLGGQIVIGAAIIVFAFIRKSPPFPVPPSCASLSCAPALHESHVLAPAPPDRLPSAVQA